MKKASEVFKKIRFAKMDPHHEKAGPFSTDDEEHYAVSTKEWEQQVKHVKKRSMQEGAVESKEKTVTVKHKTSGKELVVTVQKAKQLKQHDYHAIKEAKEVVVETKKPSSLDKFRKASDEREKKHDNVEKEMQTRHAAGKEDMKGSIDRLEKHLNKEEVQKADVPAYLRKQRGDKPLTVADVKAPRKDSISAAATLQKMKNEETKPPFDKPYTTVKAVVTDKSGAKHGPMSRARDIARAAMKKQAEKMPVKKSIKESRKSEIVKDIVKKKDPKDKFQANPTLTSQVQKIDNAVT